MRVRLPWVLVLLAICLRVLYFALVADRAPGVWPLGFETTAIAAHLVSGQGFSLDGGEYGRPTVEPTSWIAPVYPLVVSVVFAGLGTASWPSQIALVALQILLAGATVRVLYRAGVAVCGSERAGLAAALGFAVSLPLVHNAATLVWSTSGQCLLIAVFTLVAVRKDRSAGGPSVRAAALGAGVGGAALLAPTMLLPGAFAVAWSLRRQWRGVVIAAVVALAFIGVWVGRNAVVMERVTFIKSNFGHELYIGNHPGADGHYQRPGEIIGSLEPVSSPLRRPFENEVDYASALGSRAKEWIAANPSRFAWLCWQRIQSFFGRPYFVAGDGESSLRRFVARGHRLFEGVLLVLIVLGGCRHWRRAWPVAVLVLLYALPYLLTHADILRYRAPSLTLQLLLAGLAFAKPLVDSSSRSQPDSSSCS